MALCSISEFGWEVNERQVNIRWMQATADGILENVTVVVSLDIHQDDVPVKKPRIEVYWSLFRLRLHKFSRPEYSTDENDFSDDGLFFELDGDDTGFDGIFEEQ